LGVFSGMGLMKSAKLAPDAILLPANFDAYRDCSRRFKAAVATIAPLIEDRGIDEIYIDLSDIPEETYSLAKRIKQAVLDATGLTCSIGVTPNKLLSKICSDLDKPNGITLLGMDEVASRIWPLPARKINGIGPKATERLTKYGINTIGELAATPVNFLVGKFGENSGHWLHRVAHGIDDRPVVTASAPKSISRESTFERDLHAQFDKAELSEIFTSLCLRVADDLKRKGYASKTIGIKLRYSDFHAVTRDVTLPVGIADGMEIRKAAGECLKRVPLNQRIRLLGVRAGGLLPINEIESGYVTAQATLPF
jgi:DNA polymerase-4